MFLSIGLVSLFLCAVLFLAAAFISFSRYRSREKAGGFECGFDREVSSRSPFSLRFFILLLLFVVFDVEIALLVPCLVSFLCSSSWLGILSTYFFLLVLGLGLFYEWLDGGLD